MHAEPSTRKPITIAAARHSGTHLIQPIVRALSGRAVHIPKGEASLTDTPAKCVIVWLRDPRDWLISCYRWKNPDALPRVCDADLARFITAKRKERSFVEFIDAWSRRWVDWPGAHTARFEDIVGLGAQFGVFEIRGVMEFLGHHGLLARGADPVEAYKQCYGTSGTSRPVKSDHRQWAGSKTWAIFEEEPMRSTIPRMGYRP